jgi:hypothetical protein
MSYKRDPNLDLVDSITDKINASISQLEDDKADKENAYDLFVAVIKKGKKDLLKKEEEREGFIDELESGDTRRNMFKSINFVPRDTLFLKEAKKRANSKIPEHIKRLSKRFDMYLAAIEAYSPQEESSYAAVKTARRKLLRLYNKLYAVDSNRLEEIIIEHEKALNDFVFKLTAFLAKTQRDEEELNKQKAP